MCVYNPRAYEKAASFCSSIKARLIETFLAPYQAEERLYQTYRRRIEIDFAAVDDLQAAAEEADIILTATPSRQPLIRQEWVKPGTHLSCVGADMEGKQEIDEHLFAKARVFVDDVTQAAQAGETEIAVKKGIIAKGDIAGEIGSVILGKTPGRLSQEDITLFDSTGIALQDLITADYVLQQAEEKGLGMVAYL
ncbi:ornithine cyclodeaminase family protein [Brevibacillus marinus]|uniref:ornithine cyclodeaminase family protein n=1 Tax=Brevibacillus marinus TaxID=2496837 RepID=UPI0013DFC0D7|nr:hypothetical protein [Brevibacillus marinus]